MEKVEIKGMVDKKTFEEFEEKAKENFEGKEYMDKAIQDALESWLSSFEFHVVRGNFRPEARNRSRPPF